MILLQKHISSLGFMCKVALSTWLALACLSVAADDLGKTQGRQILDTARPVASEKAGQPVCLKFDKLNVDGDWALLIGNLVSASGKGVDRRLASECDPDLDKMLWVVLKKRLGAWRVKHIDICAPEPPYWYLKTMVAWFGRAAFMLGWRTAGKKP